MRSSIQRAALFHGALLLLRLWMMAAPASASNADQVLLTIQFRDQSGGALLPVRAGVFQGLSLPPVDKAATMYQELGPSSHFCCNGSVQVLVSAGPVTIRAGHGFEYVPLDTTISVAQPMTATVTLRRFANMNASGWYSADTHVHITHQPAIYSLGAADLLRAMQAEDLNYVNSMEEQSNFTGVIDPLSLPNRIIHFSKEERDAHFSHLAILGMKQWIFDQGCITENVLCGRSLDKSIHDQVHAQAGETAVVATHPFATTNMDDVTPWPGGGMWRGMAIDLPAGAVDAMDLLTYTNMMPPACVGPYFNALNAGFHLAPSAGTDCTLATGGSGPVGGYRTYVHVNGAFTMDSWIAAFKAGRSFVSNYPLITHFDVKGAQPGDNLGTNANNLRGTVSVTCAVPVARVEIIGNAGTLVTINAAGGSARSINGSFNIPTQGLTWVVARVTGPESAWHPISANGLFAQTAPIYVNNPALGSTTAVSGANLATTTNACRYFLDQLVHVETAYDAGGYFPDNSRPAFDQAVLEARAYFQQQLAVTAVPVGTPPLPWSLSAVWPNPASDHARVTYAVPAAAGAHEVGVYDAAGRSVRRLYSGNRAPGSYELDWDGRDVHGAAVASGVYFIRVQPRNAPSVARKIVIVH